MKKLIKWVGSALTFSAGAGPSLGFYAALIAASIAAYQGALYWHGLKVKAIQKASYEAGQAEVNERWQRARFQAADQQSKMNESADESFTTEREVVKVIYQDRVKEVKTYVPSPNTDCPADAGFLQRYNAAAAPTSGAGGTEDQ